MCVCALSQLTVSMCALSQLTVSVRALSLLTVSVCVRVCFFAVHYNAYHELEDEPFDSTRLRREIMKFRLGCGGSDSDVCLDDLVFFLNHRSFLKVVDNMLSVKLCEFVMCYVRMSVRTRV